MDPNTVNQPWLAQDFEVSWLKRFVELLPRINRWKISLDPFDLKSIVAAKLCTLLRAEKANIYVINEATRELILQDFEDEAAIRIPLGKGIVGQIAIRGQVLNCTDPLSHEWYDRQYDEVLLAWPKASILCAPLREPHSGQIIAVVQVLGKRSAGQPGSVAAAEGALAFGAEDEAILQLVGLQLATVLCCYAIHTRTAHTSPPPSPPASIGACDGAAAVRLAGVRHLLGLKSQEAVLEEGERVTRLLAAAPHCRIYLFDSMGGPAAAGGGGGGMLRSWVDGGYCCVEAAPDTTAGWCAVRAQPLSVANVFTDRRFNANLSPPDGDAAAAACAVLCVPIFAAGQAAPAAGAGPGVAGDGLGLIGVIETIRPGRKFGGQDEAAVTDLARVLAAALPAARRSGAGERLLRASIALAESGEAGLFAAASAAAQVVLGCRRARLLLLVKGGRELWTAPPQSGVESESQGSTPRAGCPPSSDSGGWGGSRYRDLPEMVTFQVSGGAEAHVLATRKLFCARDARTARLPDGSPAVTGEWSLASEERVASGDNGRCDREAVGGREPGEAMLCAPVMAGDGRLLGLLQAVGKAETAHTQTGGGGFSEEDGEAAEGLARQLAAAIAVRDELRRRAEERDLHVRFARSLPELCWESDLERLMRLMADAVCDSLGAGHCTPYLVDPGTGMLRTRAQGLSRDLWLAAGRGAAGRAAETGRAVRIDDTEIIGLTERSVSMENLAAGTGPEAPCRSMICCPMMGSDGSAVGVLQAFHADAGAFSAAHEELLGLYARVAAAAVENRRILAGCCGGELWSLPADGDEIALRESIRACARELLQAQAASLFVVTPAGDRLVALPEISGAAPGSPQIECKPGQGIVGRVFVSGNSVLTEQAVLLPNYDPAVDRPTRQEVRTLLCAPVIDAAGGRIGALLVVNRKRGVFARKHEMLLKQLCAQSGDLLRVCRKYHRLVSAFRDF